MIMSRQFVRVAVLWALTIFAMPLAMDYSSRWNSQANPLRDVTVELISGEKLTGDLSTDWTGAKVLRTDTQVVMFRQQAIVGMTSRWPRPASGEGDDFLQHWRLAVGPSLLLSVMVLLTALPLSLMGHQRNQSGATNE